MGLSLSTNIPQNGKERTPSVSQLSPNHTNCRTRLKTEKSERARFPTIAQSHRLPNALHNGKKRTPPVLRLSPNHTNRRTRLIAEKSEHRPSSSYRAIILKPPNAPHSGKKYIIFGSMSAVNCVHKFASRCSANPIFCRKSLPNIIARPSTIAQSL
jgi:hypothetical protein